MTTNRADQLIGVARRYVGERGRLSPEQWLHLMAMAAKVAPPPSEHLFLATTFDIRDGRLSVHQEPAFLHASPMEPTRARPA